MKKIKLKESDLTNIIERVIKQSSPKQKKKIIVSENELIESIEKIVKEQMLGFGNMGGLGGGFTSPVATPTSRYKREMGEQTDDFKDRMSGDAFREDAEGGDYEGDIDEAYDDIVDKKNLEMSGYDDKKTGGTDDKRPNLDKDGKPVKEERDVPPTAPKGMDEDDEELDEQASEEEKHLAGKVTLNVVDDPAATSDGMGMFESRIRKMVNNIISEKKGGNYCEDSPKGCIRKRAGGWVILDDNDPKLGVWRKCKSEKHCKSILAGYHASKR
tara:strand:- start:841 stop:1653 length:813 start_codon:yes stop_codon:yes gene_type:complete